MIEAKAVRIVGKGDVDALQLGTISVAEPGPSELLVRVAAAGLNRADTLQRKGFYPAPKGVVADVPGLEFAGEVERVGAAGLRHKRQRAGGGEAQAQGIGADHTLIFAALVLAEPGKSVTLTQSDFYCPPLPILREARRQTQREVGGEERF